MGLTKEQIDVVQGHFDNDINAQHALLLAQPNGGGLQLLVDVLRAAGYPNGAIQLLAVFYSFNGADNPPSRSGATLPGQPVRGKLVTGEGGPDVDGLNRTPAIVGALSFPEVYPRRLEGVREQWVACAEKIEPAPHEDDVLLTAQTLGLRVSLSAFAGGAGAPGCKGSSCPGNAKVGSG